MCHLCLDPAGPQHCPDCGRQICKNVMVGFSEPEIRPAACWDADLYCDQCAALHRGADYDAAAAEDDWDDSAEDDWEPDDDDPDDEEEDSDSDWADDDEDDWWDEDDDDDWDWEDDEDDDWDWEDDEDDDWDWEDDEDDD